jgi:hypothetical protein
MPLEKVRVPPNEASGQVGWEQPRNPRDQGRNQPAGTAQGAFLHLFRNHAADLKDQGMTAAGTAQRLSEGGSQGRL